MNLPFELCGRRFGLLKFDDFLLRPQHDACLELLFVVRAHFSEIIETNLVEAGAFLQLEV